MRKHSALLIVTFLAFALPPSSSARAATPPDITAWLWQHPEIANAIAFDFPDTLPQLPGAAQNPRHTPLPWLQKTGKTATAAVATRTGGDQSASGVPPGTSCPTPFDTPAAGKRLVWCQWPESYRQRLKSHFERYWNWVEQSWPLYEPYRESGFTAKPAGFDERFASKIDPDTGATPGRLPFAAQFQPDDDHLYVLYDTGAAIDLFLKLTALQLVMDRSPYLGWKLSDYDETDLSLILNGGTLFSFIPAGDTPYGQWTTETEGYKARFILASPPLTTLKFLMNEGLLAETRFETAGRFLEWQRRMTHLYSGITDEVGPCGNVNDEIIWGFPGVPPLSSFIYGSVMACKDPPGGEDGTLGYRETLHAHYTRGCTTSGIVGQQALRAVNIPVEDFRRNVSHSQTRYVVEQQPFEAMLANIGPSLPFEPSLTAASNAALFRSLASLNVGNFGALAELKDNDTTPPPLFRKTAYRAVTAGRPPLANAYIDHNDDPYALKGEAEIAVQETLIDETTFRRWFPEMPTGLTEQQKTDFRELHDRRVGFRVTQLRIARLPLKLFDQYCLKQDAGKPREQTELYKNYLSDYSPAELESMGFWARFDQKLEELGGCEGLP